MSKLFLKLSCQIISYDDVVVLKCGFKIFCSPFIKRWVCVSFPGIWAMTTWSKEYGRKDAVLISFYKDSIILIPKLGKDNT